MAAEFTVLSAMLGV